MVALVVEFGAGTVAAALTRVSWWQFAAICFIYGLSMGIDAVAWQYTLAEDRVPFHKLLAARSAGEASNALTAVSAVGSEAIKAWLVRLEVPYQESIPSLILSKTAEVIGQTLLLALGIVVAAAVRGVSASLLTAMSYLLVVQVLAVGGFALVQLVGGISHTGRVLSWMGIDQSGGAQQLDAALRRFYRHDWRRFVASTALHCGGALLAIADAYVVLYSLQVVPSLAVATVIEALWSGVRFATFFVPGSLGPLEGANAAAFPAFGLSASAGLAFTLVRRARQLVWICVGIVILIAMRPRRDLATPQVQPAPSSAG